MLRASRVEFEAEVPFGGLHLLLHPFLDRLDGLPGPRAAACAGRSAWPTSRSVAEGEGDVASAVGPIGALVGAVRRGTVDSLTVETISGLMALLVADDDGAAAMSAALVAGLCERGALGWLPYASTWRSGRQWPIQ